MRHALRIASGAWSLPKLDGSGVSDEKKRTDMCSDLLAVRQAARDVLAGLAIAVSEGMAALSHSPAGEAAFSAACASSASFAALSLLAARGGARSHSQPSPVVAHALLVVRLLTCDPWADWKAFPVTCFDRCMAALNDGAVQGACQARQKVIASSPLLHVCLLYNRIYGRDAEISREFTSGKALLE